MIISIPDKFTIERSEKYILSIRLRPDGLSFSAYNPLEADSWFFREVEYKKEIPFLIALKELFFENDFFSWSYKKTNLIFTDTPYVLIPTSLLQVKEDSLSFIHSSPGERVLVNPLTAQNASLVYGVNGEVYEFCSRSLINPDIFHSLTPLLSLWGEQKKGKGMYLIVRKNEIDILCFDSGRLSFLNTFQYIHRDDILYYVLYIWEQMNLEQMKDALYVVGELLIQKEVIKGFSVYLNQVYPVEIPADAYLLGDDIQQASMDLIALSVCGL
ncbi:MAG: DUF3822 family protein [Tannerellaceae bacterium]|nr:DUF3822 family protein [Tannerellaceae bacterium]